MKPFRNPEVVVTDKCPCYRAAMKAIGNERRLDPKGGRHLDNRAENSHRPFRRREKAMPRFRRMRGAQEVRLRSLICTPPFQPSDSD